MIGLLMALPWDDPGHDVHEDLLEAKDRMRASAGRRPAWTRGQKRHARKLRTQLPRSERPVRHRDRLWARITGRGG